MRHHESLEGWFPDDSVGTGNPNDPANRGRGADVAVRQHRLTKYRPRKAKKIASWTSIGLGAIMIMPVFDQSSRQPGYETMSMTSQVIMALCYMAMFVLPGAYWLWRNRRDSQIVREWASTSGDYWDVWESLDPMTKAAFATPTDELPLLPKRHWWAIIIAMFVLAFIGGSLLPPQV